MGDERFASIEEVNGIGGRVNDLALRCEGCRARTEERLSSGDKRMDSQNADISEIKVEVKRINATIYKAMGLLAALGFIAQIVLFYIGKVWQP